MTWQTVALADVAPSPWKNGGGVTRELLAWPTPVAWVFRLSVAEVQADGPFSRFEGVLRWFAVLSGAGVRLRLGDAAPIEEQVLTPASHPFCFDGARPVNCRLIDGTTQDFNLMVREDQARARMQRVTRPLHLQAAGVRTVAVWSGAAGAELWVGEGRTPLPAQTLAWQEVPAGLALKVNALEALVMEIERCP
jgi:environmental stress-induced protein Ves